MKMTSLYVTVTADCEDLANHIFPSGCEWEITDEDCNDDGTGVIRYEWNGDMQAAIEQRLNSHRDVISYQILD